MTLDSPPRNSATVVFLRADDYKRLLALFGGLGADGRGSAMDLVLVPWPVAEQAGWAQHPHTVKTLTGRLDDFCYTNQARRVETILSPQHPLLANPSTPPPAPQWRIEAEAAISSKPVSMHDLIPFDPDLEETS
jgi:hypothetical protein